MAVVFDAPSNIVGGEFEIRFSKGTPTHMPGIYSGLLDPDIPVSMHLGCKGDPDINTWYDVAMMDTSQHFLRMFSRFDYGSNNVILITEKVDDTLATWVKKRENSLLADAPSARLSRKFQIILSDVINGFDHLRLKHHRQHGSFLASSVFIVNGRAKLGCIGDLKTMKLEKGTYDVDRFLSMITSKPFFDGLKMPTDFGYFCNSLKSVPSSEYMAELRHKKLCSFATHPALLTAEQKLWYRQVALLDVSWGGLTEKVKENLGRSLRPKSDWREGVLEGSVYRQILHFNMHGPVQAAYSSYPFSYWTYCNDIYEHRRQYNVQDSDEKLDAILDSFWPAFMSVMHEVLVDMGVIVRLPSNWL